MNLRGESAHVGRRCGSSEYRVTAEGVNFFSDALEDRDELYGRFAPPLLYHSECYRFVGDWYLQNLVGNLHAQQDWELFAPIEVGSTVKTRSTIVDRYSKRGRDYVVNETDVISAVADQLLVRGRTYQSFVPRQATDRSAEKAPKRSHPPFPVAKGRDLRAAVLQVDERRCWMFSGPERNYHTDREEAPQTWFSQHCCAGHALDLSGVEGYAAGVWRGLDGGRKDVGQADFGGLGRRTSAVLRTRSRVGPGGA